MMYSLWQSSYSLYHQVVTGECPSLIETTNVHLPSEGDPERLSAVDAELGQRYQRGVDGEREFNWQLRWHNRGQD